MTKQSDSWDVDNLPNRLTLFRIFLIPVIVSSLYLTKLSVIPEKELQYGIISGFIFFIAGLTDFFDGYIARKRKIITVFGSFLDPIADKFLVISSLIMLLALDRVPDLVVLILVLREMYMTSLRLLANSQQVQVPVNDLGKWKTATQMMAIPMLMIGGKWLGIPFFLIGQILIYIAALLSLLSALIYSGKVLKRLKQRRKEVRLARKEKRLRKKYSH